jgi:signal transduction histidine kinase
MEIVIPITDPMALLEIALVVLLLAWAGYGYGRRTERTWQAALHKLPLGVVLFDATGQSVFMNSTATLLLQRLDVPLEQIHQSVVQGLRHISIVPGRDGVSVQAQSWSLSKHGTGAKMLLTLQDVTQQREQQRRTEMHYRKLTHTLSHELFTPVATIQQNLAIVTAIDRRDSAEWRRWLQVMSDETERLTRLVSNLLTLSRLESGQPLRRQLTSLKAIAEDAMGQLLERASARRITLDIGDAPDLPRVFVDQDKWREVFLNLIDNGIKYGKEDGFVKVTLRQNSSTPALSITVADDGFGISLDDLPHLFTESFRAKSSQGVSGSGLGLAIVRRIVEQHEGEITCSSELGRGTTFHITLPLNSQMLHGRNIA